MIFIILSEVFDNCTYIQFLIDSGDAGKKEGTVLGVGCRISHVGSGARAVEKLGGDRESDDGIMIWRLDRWLGRRAMEVHSQTLKSVLGWTLERK
jgi:hypothetical protein